MSHPRQAMNKDHSNKNNNSGSEMEGNEILQRLIQRRKIKGLENFYDSKLRLYQKGKLSKWALYHLFQEEALAYKGISVVQWIFSQEVQQIREMTFDLLIEMRRLGILTQAQLLKLLIEPNCFNRSAYHYTIRAYDRETFLDMGDVVRRSFKNKEFSENDLFSLLTRIDGKGMPFILHVLHASKSRVNEIKGETSLARLKTAVASLYFEQWIDLIESNQVYCVSFANVLTQVYLIKESDNRRYQRNIFHDVFQTWNEEILDLYFNKLHFCLSKGVLTKEKYWQTITSVKTNIKNTLELASYRPLKFIKRYLEELEYYATIVDLTAFHELITLFMPLLQNAQEFKGDQQEKIDFVNKQIADSFDKIRRIKNDRVQAFGRAASFYEIFQVGDAEILDLFFNRLRLGLSQGTVTKENYWQTITSVKASGKNTLGLALLKGPSFLERYLKELVHCAVAGIASFQELANLFMPLMVNPAGFKAGLRHNIPFANERLADCFEQLMNIQKVDQLPGLIFFKELAAHSAFNAQPLNFFRPRLQFQGGQESLRETGFESKAEQKPSM